MSVLRTQERSLLQNLRNRLAYFGATATRGTVDLIAGTATVDASFLASSDDHIFLTVQTLGTVAVPKAVAVTAKTPGTSFVITSSDNTDTSTVSWLYLPS